MTSLYLIAVFTLLIAWQKTRKFALLFPAMAHLCRDIRLHALLP